jgi:hypothetical protein
MAVAAELSPISVDREWLTSRMFSFRAGPRRQLYAGALRFEPNGRITGYRNRNETSWSLDDGQLTILRADGIPSCVAAPVRNAHGTISFEGRFLHSAEDIVHCFEENPVDDAHRVFSFDLFDTLVARRCYDPIAIFDSLEKSTGVVGFAHLRKDEEHKLWQAGDYTFTDIYEALATATHWPAATLERLRILELEEEWTNLFPIAEMVCCVRPGDLIVSDMYLPLSFVRRIVENKCGLTGCGIHLTSHGKSRGDIWPVIRTTHHIMRHYGDNAHSDIDGARRANVSAEHVTVSRWTHGERILVDVGLGEFAKILREARLQSFDTDYVLRSAQLAQYDVNLPLLIVAGLHVLQIARERQMDTLLMCSRDCNLWFPLLQWMAARSSGKPTVRYIISSRVLLLSDSREYAAYYAQLRGERTLLIDVSGTGRSPSYFLSQRGDQANSGVYLLVGTHEVANFVDKLAPPRDDVYVEMLCEYPHDQRLTVESLNMCVEPKSHQMVYNQGRFEPLQLPHEFGSTAQTIIATMRTVFLDAVSRLSNCASITLPEDIRAESLRTAAKALIELVGDYRNAHTPIRRDINRDEENTARAALAERRRNQST